MNNKTPLLGYENCPRCKGRGVYKTRGGGFKVCKCPGIEMAEEEQLAGMVLDALTVPERNPFQRRGRYAYVVAHRAMLMGEDVEMPGKEYEREAVVERDAWDLVEDIEEEEAT